MTSVVTKPAQRTEYVVRRSASRSATAVYRGSNAAAARDAARSYQRATVTFKTQAGADAYLTRR